jgi:hypothetical protein
VFICAVAAFISLAFLAGSSMAGLDSVRVEIYVGVVWSYLVQDREQKRGTL